MGDFILKLNSLHHNSTIGIVAPASSENKILIDEKIFKFEELGFNLKKGKYIYDRLGYLTGSDKDRANDLMDMFIDKNIAGIVCLRGGYGSMRIVPYLDFEIIKNNPKPFCGYSDITLLLNLINQKCSFPTFHGPMINSNFADSITKEYFINTLTNSNKNIIYNLNNINKGNIEILNGHDFKGRLVGGNLSIICSTLGTPYEINFNNSILLIEEVNEEPYVVDRLLTQLLISNNFKNCNGILLGNFTNCNLSNSNSLKLNEVIEQKLIPLNIPIIKGFPSGHSYPNITLPIGADFNYSYKNNILQISSQIFY